jgi:hypothetical protein
MFSLGSNYTVTEGDFRLSSQIESQKWKCSYHFYKTIWTFM